MLVTTLIVNLQQWLDEPAHLLGMIVNCRDFNFTKIIPQVLSNLIWIVDK